MRCVVVEKTTLRVKRYAVFSAERKDMRSYAERMIEIDTNIKAEASRFGNTQSVKRDA